ncbi:MULTISPECIES: Rha family transcriptional regulator [Thiorhodovibrio]|uniref:Rha family transcriptional regulator n=1 Tax=Thiorhodovibrio TaxID=61593 RepID=UPI0019128140|nr:MULTISPECIES: Rha family transcriptional regulator [Thiorhodovibrio]MBK5969497.1 hypothetical protein [Thiorhodovibrio winogradskyi]WPL11952.1 putative phage-encoded protein [Thiorhodovibrio litoralis]WPL12332.1 putative phage-encoded protein [Thiorhodovibrio litoralis]
MGLMVLNASDTFPLAMSSREIAELTGKTHGHVLRDIRKMLKNLYRLDDKPKLDQLQIQSVTIEKDDRGYIARIDLDKDHTLTLLTGYNDQARLRVVRRWQALEKTQVRPLSPAELMIAHGQALLAAERDQAEQAERIARLEQRVDLMGGDTGYRTITAYMKQNGIRLPISESRQKGIAAAKLARERGERIGNIPDERFGSVNSYPIDVLDEVFSLAG